MNKKFEELNVGDKFTYNNTEYTKIEKVKVSCCRSVNCVWSSDNNKREFVDPSTEVAVKDE
jgi:hypothetical protein